MKLWSAFYPDVAIEVHGAPDPVVDFWLRAAATEFFARSKAHVVALDDDVALAGQMEYALDPPTRMDVVEICAVAFAGRPLDPAAPSALGKRFGDWLSETGTPTHYTQRGDLTSVLLVPAPIDAGGSIKVSAALAPGSAAVGIDDALFARWHSAISAGCKAKMMMMPSVSWANPDRAAVHAATFESAIQAATTAANDGFVRSRPRFSGKFC